jgi:hypothetical protein
MHTHILCKINLRRGTAQLINSTCFNSDSVPKRGLNSTFKSSPPPPLTLQKYFKHFPLQAQQFLSQSLTFWPTTFNTYEEKYLHTQGLTGDTITSSHSVTVTTHWRRSQYEQSQWNIFWPASVNPDLIRCPYISRLPDIDIYTYLQWIFSLT